MATSYYSAGVGVPDRRFLAAATSLTISWADSRIGRMDGDTDDPQRLRPLPEAHFIEVHKVEVPDQPLPFGGRVQILSVERYDTRVTVTWRLAPRPDPLEEHALAMAAFEQESAGLSEEERNLARVNLATDIVSNGQRVIALADDLGTRYQGRGGGGSGGAGEWIGRADFVPALPAGASALTVHWGALEFPVNLT